MVRPNGSVIGRLSDAEGLKKDPVILSALLLRQPPRGIGAKFRSHNLCIIRSRHNRKPALVRCKQSAASISGFNQRLGVADGGGGAEGSANGESISAVARPLTCG